MVSELSTCLGKRLALGNRGANLLLDRVDLFSRSENRLLVRVRQDHHAVGVSAQEIPGATRASPMLTTALTASTCTRSFPVRIE